MPHYVLDARTATPHFPGIGRYIRNLAEALIPLLSDDERLTVLTSPGYSLKLPARPTVQSISVDASPFSLRQQWVVRRLVKELGANLYHSPYYLMPYRVDAPSVLTVHDLIPILLPQYSSRRARWLFVWLVLMALRASAHVVTGSQDTRTQLLARFTLSQEKVTVVPLAADPDIGAQPTNLVHNLRQRYRLWDPFVLYVGSNQRHKNLVRLVEAWAEVVPSFPHTTLVVAGSWIPTLPEARIRAEELGLGEQSLRWLGPLSEQDLPAFYSAASLFVFPSLYEGFGLPVIEAMACGAPVACSNVSSLPEVVGDAALLFDPRDPASISGTITKALSDEALRVDLRNRGLARATTFSWERTARETLEIYRRVSAGSASSTP
ncbi:MAG: glycosyltransferase family 4 protein [Anaerolineae bacterium]|jgi:alpha-1,3-rhamnosyl/mannosyltransferase|nr:glycosyltransferase family 4 protein [Anaerolineae bacterium]